MTRRQEIRSAIRLAEELVERNRNPLDTFEGVLNRSYVRALNTLVRAARASLRPRPRES
ncbi:MAG: hypothetical protein ACE5HL_12695 [Terriglobia bacterium]